MRENEKECADAACVSPEEKIEANITRKTRLNRRLRRDALIKAVGFTAAVYIAFTFVFGICLAPTNDMFPAIHQGDTIIYYRPGRLINTDVVYYEAPDGTMQIGRIEATEGEEIGMTAGGLLTIGGNIQPVQERSGLYSETYAGERDLTGTVSEGKFLILGDSRETASDSRTFGYICRDSIRGKVFTIIRRRP